MSSERERYVTANDAGWLVRKSERVVRKAIASGELPATRRRDGHTWRIAVSALARVARWQVDPERIAELEAATAKTTHDRIEPDTSGPLLRALVLRVEALERTVAGLAKAQTTTGSIRIDPVVPPRQQAEAPSGPPPAPPLPRRAPVPTRPLGHGDTWTRYDDVPEERLVAAILRGVREGPLWKQDARQARAGLLRIQVWGHLCRVAPETTNGHVKRAREGKMRRNIAAKLTFAQAREGDLRYVDATQRAAWLAYWREVSPILGVPHATRVPSDAEVAHVLQVMGGWRN